MKILLHGLTLIFVFLKLTGELDWNWVATFAPSIASFSITIVFLLVASVLSAFGLLR